MTPFQGINRVTSPYGWRTLNGKVQFHYGQDIVGDNNQNIRAIWNAIKCEVVKTYNGGRGWTVYLYYNNTLRVLNQHMGRIDVQNGQKVKQGQVIGLMGNTGDSFGAHLHIEVQVYKNGKWTPVEPSQYTEVPNYVGKHPGNDKLDSSPNPNPSPTPARELYKCVVGPVSSGDNHTMTSLAKSLQLSINEIKSGSNMTILEIGPMTSGDKNAIESKAKALKLGVNTTTAKV